MSRLVCASLAVVLAVPLAAQRAPTSAAITAADLRHRLFLIAHDSMMGRETGSLGDWKATEYVAAEFQRMGLRPAGENGTWFQTVPFWIAAPAAPTLAVAGGGTLKFGSDYVIVGRPLTAPAGDVVAIYGGTANDSTTWIDGPRAAGKLVVFDIRPDESGSRKPVATGLVFNSPRFAPAAALAIAQLDLMPAAAAANLSRFTPRADTTRLAGRPSLIITAHAAEVLLGAPAARLQVAAIGRTVTGDLTLHFVPVPYPARNVIGVLPGRDPALRNTYMSLSAHHDHVGVCMSAVDHDSIRAFNTVLRPMGVDTRAGTYTVTPEATAKIQLLIDSARRVHPVRPDSICNGADDDGSGTVALLELAESFASMLGTQRPRRSLLFVSHAAEERGLLGSAWFTDHPTVPVDSIVAEIDEDMIGRGAAHDYPGMGPTYLEVIGARRLSNEFGDILEAANAAQELPFKFDYTFDAPGHRLQYYCRADHYNYARYGIPAVAFSRGEHMDYHQVTDEPQYINYPDLTRVVNMVHDAALRIANLDHFPKLDKPKGDPHARCVQ